MEEEEKEVMVVVVVGKGRRRSWDGKDGRMVRGKEEEDCSFRRREGKCWEEQEYLSSSQLDDATIDNREFWRRNRRWRRRLRRTRRRR